MPVLKLTIKLPKKTAKALEVLQKGGHITLVNDRMEGDSLSIVDVDENTQTLHHKVFQALKDRGYLKEMCMCITDSCDVYSYQLRNFEFKVALDSIKKQTHD